MQFRLKGRTVNAYIDPKLKEDHKEILSVMACYYEPTEPAGAYVKGKPMYVTIQKHVNDTYFLKTDIKGFFDNLELEYVYEIMDKKIFESEYKKIVKKAIKQCATTPTKGILQGSVLASLISNMYMEEFDKHWSKSCEERGITYTRYSDDMVFSSKVPFDTDGLVNELVQSLNAIGLELNEKKTQVINKDTQNHVKILGVNIIFGRNSNYVQKPRRKELNVHQSKSIEYINRMGGNNE